MIRELLREGYSRDDIIGILLQNHFAQDIVAAEFLISVELGEIVGDDIVIDRDGNESAPKSVLVDI